jgi:diguanylate cyclase (GGDEF)-like protein
VSDDSDQERGGVPLAMLQRVSLTARAELLFGAVERRLAAGEVLLRGGEPNDTMYLLTEGKLEVHLTSIDDDPIAFIAVGETVGELSLLDGSVASASVVATNDSTVLAVSEDQFWQLVNGSHAFAVELLVKLGERLRANNSTVSQNVLRRRMYERAAMFDGLTGIHNRRWLDDTLHRMVARHRERGGSLCVALIDIDHFKHFNDTYGHDAGDFVLATVAGSLAANLRPTDLVARFGGEEFVIIFPETPLAAAASVSDRLRQAVAERDFVMPGDRALPRVTISIGVAQLAPDQTVPSLLKVADTAMYSAKRSGRNRVLTGTTPE